MKKYQVKIPPSVESYLRNLHPETKAKIRNALNELEKDPFLGKPLKEQLKGLLSYRVSHYRIVYEIKQKEILIEVIDIAQRKVIYEQVLKYLQKI